MEGLRVGLSFASYSAIENLISEIEKENFIQLYKRTSETIERYKNRMKRPKDVNADIKYVRLEYACIHGGKNFKSESKGDRPNTSTFRMKCPFHVKFGLSDDGKSLMVTSMETNHNHSVNETSYKHLPRQRKLDDEEKNKMVELLNLKSNKKLIQDHFQRTTGKVITMRDIHNVTRSADPSDDSSMLKNLIEEMKKVGGAIIQIVKDDDSDVVKGIYFQDKTMVSIFEKYPELLLIDATYKLNNHRLPLYVLMSVDGNGASEIVCFWIVSDESLYTIQTMTQIFKKHNPKWTDVNCIMADKDMTERQVLKSEIPHASLQICLFHVLRSFKREVTCEKLKITADQRLFALELLQKLAYARSSEKYDQMYEELKGSDMPSVLEYFDTNWHSIHHEWVEAFKSKFTNFMNRTNNRVESINQKIKSVVNKFSTVVTFFQDLMKLVGSLRTERDHKAVRMFQKVKVLADPSMSQFQQTLTAYAYKYVCEQKDLSLKLQYTGEITNSTVAIAIDCGGSSVTVTSTSCDCAFFTSMALPCKHIFFLRAKKGESLFDQSTCAPRWSKSYFKRSHVVFQDFEYSSQSSQSVIGLVQSPGQKRRRILSGQDKFRRAMDAARKLATVISETSTRDFSRHLANVELLTDMISDAKEYNIVGTCQSADNDTHIAVQDTQIADIDEPTPILLDDNHVSLSHSTDIDTQLADYDAPTADHDTPIADHDTIADINEQTVTPIPHDDNHVCTSDTSDHDLTTPTQDFGNTSPSFQPPILRISTNLLTHDNQENTCTETMDRPEEVRKQHLDTPAQVIDLLCDDRGSSITPGLDQTTIPSRLKLPPKMKRRGRPKGAEVTVIGLPRGRNRSGRTIPFIKLAPIEKEKEMLSWVVTSDLLHMAINTGCEISVDALPSKACDLPNTIIDENVNIERIKKYFTKGAWDSLKMLMREKREEATWCCHICKMDISSFESVGCDRCLQWFHLKCVSLKSAPKQLYWFCKTCR